MRRVPPLPPTLIFYGDRTFDDTTLKVMPSNQGEPYRTTVSISFERGAHGSFKNYEHLASLELSSEEACRLRDFLNQMFPPP